MRRIQIELLHDQELSDLISHAVRSEIEKIANAIPSPEEYLTRNQAKNILQVSLPTLDKWTKDGSIPCCRIANQIRFKRSEIDAMAEDIPNMRYKR